MHRLGVMDVRDLHILARGALPGGDRASGEIPVGEVPQLGVEPQLRGEIAADDDVRRAGRDRVVLEHVAREAGHRRRFLERKGAQLVVDDHRRSIGVVRADDGGGGHLPGELLGPPQVIVVEKGHPVAVGGLEARVARGRRATPGR
jgi:hypothetical protein